MDKLTVLFSFMDQCVHQFQPLIVQSGMELRLNLHPARGGHDSGAFLLGNRDAMHLVVFIENAEFFFHLRNLILKME